MLASRPLLASGLLGLLSLLACSRPADLVPSANQAEMDRLTIALATRVPAKEILAPPHPLRSPIVPLRGTIREYVEAVVRTNGVGQITRVGVVPCKRNPAGRCVEIHGDACPPGAWTGGSDCEGVSLTVVVDVSRQPAVLDRAVGPDGSELRDQIDVEHLLQQAP